MHMATLRNKIVEVHAAARVIVIKQIYGFTDEQLADSWGQTQ